MSAWQQPVTLAGRYVTLRPIDRADRAELLEAFADGLDNSFATIVPAEATIDGWFDQIEHDSAAGRAMVFTVLDSTGQVSGTTRFLRMAEAHRRLEIGGTVYARRVQRTGLNTDAKRLLLTYAFEALDCQCVQLRTDTLNRQSRRAIERLGARQDGVLRGHKVMPGHVRDTVVYSILAHEWPGVRRNLDALLAGHEEAL
ncbi:RimJ/RimL family protein N-acetyltransferase [Hephaestia caeni]|uniref:RimJ/RimL family protein N-acetyltransferase n=1 Tax=Hephaestia caeni TaxID=645617 RepID=A0A397PM80_9SPHN|nr:GNAT family protein [Hephaestia caeni]RIA46811.1 RimJ/RimL family protein N-acetyltransferase [Hephaestia caeni]